MLEESCLIIAGEKSEKSMLSVFLSFNETQPKAKFFGVGGDEMRDVRS